MRSGDRPALGSAQTPASDTGRRGTPPPRDASGPPRARSAEDSATHALQLTGERSSLPGCPEETGTQARLNAVSWRSPYNKFSLKTGKGGFISWGFFFFFFFIGEVKTHSPVCLWLC